MERSATNRGFSVVEVLLASALFALMTVALSGTYLYGEQTTASAGMRSQATYLALEGLEAVRNIRDASYTNLTSGSFGLASTSGVWEFSGSSDTKGAFTRTITISAGGSNRTYATSTVTWQDSPQRVGSVALATEFTNWAAANSSMAACFIVNTAGAVTSGKTITGITLQNTCTATSTIATMSVSWTQNGIKITQIVINGSAVWSGSSNSGAIEDITDTDIGPNKTIPLTSLTFSKNRSGTTAITITMIDGTATTTPSF